VNKRSKKRSSVKQSEEGDIEQAIGEKKQHQAIGEKEQVTSHISSCLRRGRAAEDD